LGELPSSVADGFNNFADRINHELRLLLMYFVAAIRVGDMLFVRHKFREPFVCLFLRGIDHIAEVGRHVWWQFTIRDHYFDLRTPWMISRQNNNRHRIEHGAARI